MKKVLITLLLFINATAHATVSDYALAMYQKPIAFSVVREDSDQDLDIIKRYFPETKVSMLMVASGGCTAAHLIAHTPLKDLTIVDPNGAQLALTKLKIQLLTLPTKKRLEILGHLPLPAQQRKNIIQGYAQALDIDLAVFGDLNEIAEHGFDHVGRYEKVFEELRRHLAQQSKDLENLFECTDIKEQMRVVAPDAPLGKALDTALDDVMSQDNLVKIFGEKATANRVQNFSRHFAQRLRTYLSHHLASSSAWVAYMLLGRFTHDVMFPWLTSTCSQPMPKISYIHGFMDAALEQAAPESYDVVHLSNIIDWLSPQEAEKTLTLAHRALKPGGAVIIRQLNSNVDIMSLGKNFTWNTKASQEFLHNDRSFFYRNFFIGFKHRPSAAPRVQACADAVLQQTPVIKGSFFTSLDTMNKEVFKQVQTQFFFAVDYFSRPMAALIARLPLHKDRIDTLHNIVEEHGDFDASRYHANTFKQFLSTIGVSSDMLAQTQPAPVVNMFNYTLMGTCANEDPLIATACNGIIEYAFADISALLAQKVVERGWVKKEKLVHYNLHADIDKQHAEDFFKIVEQFMDNPEQRNKIIAGLQLGAYIFNRLYEDLYSAAQTSQHQ